MTNVNDEGYEPTQDNNSNTNSGFRGHRGFGPGFRAGFGARAGFGPNAPHDAEEGEPNGRPGFGPGFPWGGPGFGGGFPGRGGHFGPRGFRGGRGLGGHLGEVVLAERFARGEIDATEYRERIAVLREVQAEGRAAHEADREARSKKDKPSDA